MSRQEDIYLGPRKHWEEKRRHSPWHRHLPCLVPLGACGLLLVLIVGAMQVRQLIIRRSPSGSDGRVEQPLESEPPEHKAKRSAQSSVPAPVDPALQSSEPGYEILPPPAARAPGRKLPKMLLVGDRPEMFPSLEEALNVAISGDIIEIRTNRPLVTAARYEAKGQKSGASLTIRGGTGFQPVLRCGLSPDVNPDYGTIMFEFTNTRVALAGLHCANQFEKGFTFLRLWGGGVTAHDCSFTYNCSPPAASGDAIQLMASDSELQKDPEAKAASVYLERCFFRGPTLNIVTCYPLVASIQVQNCLLVNWSVARSFRLSKSPVPTPPDCRRELLLRNNTMVSAIVFSYGHVPNREAESQNWITAENNVFVTDVILEHGSMDGHDFRELVGSHYRWKGRSNLFDVRIANASLSRVMAPGTDRYRETETVPPTLSEWNAIWGGQAEIESEMGTAPFVREIDFANHWKTLPADYELRPVGPVAALARRGIRVGCDVTKLPVPPPETLEPYKPKALGR